MPKSSRCLLKILILGAIGIFFLVKNPVAARTLEVFVPREPVAEANDFATRILGDPWDMNEYSDISQYINESGERDVVRNIQVENGVFSATSAGNVTGVETQNGWFFTLFPGYETTIHVGRTGSKYPIETNDYQCIYIAMKVDSPKANQFGPDQFRVFWFGDDRLNTGGAPYGVTSGIPLYPEYGAEKPVPTWKLYRLDLVLEPLAPGYTGVTEWEDRATWQGLRIDPTINENVNYAVDWVRLTNCAPRYVDIEFTPSREITSVWLRPEGTTRSIRIDTNVNGSSGSYRLDIQGVQPGNYYVGFGDQRSCCLAESTNALVINQTPIAKFQSPTFYSGPDYATLKGNAWDMESSEDYNIRDINCAEYGQKNGYLWLRTAPNWQQPAECRGDPPLYVSDPTIFLNVPDNINPAEYRYLTFRMYDDNIWQFVAQGSMSRWVWVVPGSGSSGYQCFLVSHDVPFDVGWNIYTVDLWDSFAGSAEAWEGGPFDACAGLAKNWKQSAPVLRVRFDPNENITDHAFYQEIDWIRLTKPIEISRGQPFPIGLDKFFPNDVFEVELFYTNNRVSQPTQHPIVFYTPPPSMPPTGPNFVYLPLAVKPGGGVSAIDADLEYIWNTASVLPGEYYICARLNDGLNQAIFCSDATVTVTG